MASFRNIVTDNQGVRWVVAYEWNVDDQSGTWQTFEAQFPRDFNEIPSEDIEQVMWRLARHVAEAQGIHD
jgi:hypothetical protein